RATARLAQPVPDHASRRSALRADLLSMTVERLCRSCAYNAGVIYCVRRSETQGASMAKPKRSAAKKSSATARKSAAAPGATPALTRPDPRLKKIYVYSEGTFVLHNASEVHKLVIKTPAFDVAGWIDLSKMAPGGDTVFTEIRVSFANRS